MRKHLHEEVHVLFKIRTKEEVITLHGIKPCFPFAFGATNSLVLYISLTGSDQHV